MDLQTYRDLYKKDQAVGALSIEENLKKIYGDLEPRFYNPQVMSFQGGNDPIDGVAIYDVNGYYHLVSYGLSHIYYSEESIGAEYSKWGFELTFRINPVEEDNNEDPFWVIQLMNNLARFVEQNKIWFNEYQFLPLGGKIRSECDTNIEGIAFVKDVDLGEIDTPHGKVIFLQIVGLTKEELSFLEENPSTENVKKVLDNIAKENPKYICTL